MKPFLFTYTDGTNDFYADPGKLHRRLLRAAAGDLPQLLEKARGDDELAALAATERMIEIARDAFQMPEVNEKTAEGVPEQFVHDALTRFFDFMDEKKNPQESFPTNSASSEPAISGAN